VSDTPRTDALSFSSSLDAVFESHETIERELSSAQASLAEEHRLNAALVSDLQAAQARIASLEEDLAMLSARKAAR